jgi:uncharacterized RDD family membrane protein YckC
MLKATLTVVRCRGEMNAFAQTSAHAPSGSKLDNRRMLAALVDLAIVAAGGAAILLAAGVLGGDGGSLGAPLAAVVVGWALYYYFACESGGGQTVGKRLTRLRVVREDGSPAGIREVAVRTVLRPVDTALVGLIAMLTTGERRGRVGDLAAGTVIVSTDATPGVAPAVVAPAASEAPVEEEPESHDEELPEVVDDEPARAYEPITREDPADEAESVVELAPRGAETEPAVEPAPVEEHTFDLATPSLKELAEDVAAAAGAEPVVEAAPEPVAELAPDVEPAPKPRPLAEVEIGGPEIDIDEPRVTVRSVDTVSAIDLVMGADEPTEDRSPAGDPPTVA